MKYPVLIAALLLLLSLPALGDEPVTTDPLQPNSWQEDLSPYITGRAFLTTTDNERQIRMLTAACARKVDDLLTRLAGAKTEQEVGALIRQIRHTETERDIAILSIFIRNAEASGQYGLAQEMKDQVARMRKFGRSLQVAAKP